MRLRLRRSMPVFRSEILAVLSALPGEGKSTFACYFALSAASAGMRTLLIDGDTYNPSISTRLAAKRTKFVEVMRGTTSIRDSITKDPDRGLHILGAPDLSDVPVGMEDLIQSRLAAFLAESRHHYDLIIIDTPAILASAGNSTFLECADHALLVVEWERTDRKDVAEALQLLGRDAAKLAGAILNKVALNWYRHYWNGRYIAAQTSRRDLRPGAPTRSAGQHPALGKIIDARPEDLRRSSRA